MWESVVTGVALLQLLKKRLREIRVESIEVEGSYKKDKRNLFKVDHNMKNFTAPSLEMLDQTFDRLQKLWKTHAVGCKNIYLIWRHKHGIISTTTSSNTNEAVNTAHGVSTTSTQVNDANSTNIDNLSDAVICAFFVVKQIMLPSSRQQETRKSSRKSVPVKTLLPALVSCDGLGGYDWSNQEKEGLILALMAFLIFKVLTKGNFMSSTPDLSFIGLDKFVNKHVVENYKTMSSEEEPKVARKNDDAPCIKEWVLDDEEEDVSLPKIEKKIVRPSIVKKEFVKSKQTEKILENCKTVENIGKTPQSERHQNWNNMMSQKLGSNFEMFNKACYVCGSF
ncbi:hypothetical protein Tco_1016685 [Tanacetum coccineum]|uniref:Uncharacterized protein n=1 Tax=Tanacetum coccineum TaxID=301880 RepID=A0ABQ5FQJ1_9ASTR